MAVNFTDLTRTLVIGYTAGQDQDGIEKTKKANYLGLSETASAAQVKAAGEAIAGLMGVTVTGIYVRDTNEILENA